jgi:thiol-disulfide isomerase/thioredoxin
MKKGNISWLVLIVLAAAILFGRYLYMKPRFIQGEKAPEFTANLLDGAAFSLSDLKGHYVLLDFWGSWCPPCRKENPRWVALFRQYEKAAFQDADGFEIVSIGIEKDEARWRNAIEKDGLYWRYHVLDKAESLRFFDSPVAQLYGVKQAPTTFLLSPQMKIIAVNPGPEDVAEILERNRPAN